MVLSLNPGKSVVRDRALVSDPPFENATCLMEGGLAPSPTPTHTPCCSNLPCMHSAQSNNASGTQALTKMP